MKLQKTWDILKKIHELFFPQPTQILQIRSEIKNFLIFCKTMDNIDDDKSNDTKGDIHDTKGDIQALLQFNPNHIYANTNKPISYCANKKNIYLYMYDRHNSIIDRTLNLLPFIITNNVGHTPEFYEKLQFIQKLYKKFKEFQSTNTKII